MPEIALPEEILQIVWRCVYSNNVASRISRHAKDINKNLQFYNNLQFNDNMMIYAMNYNVLRIMSGCGGLVYSS